MHVIITTHREEIVALCERLGVRRLDVFGSATTSAFDELSSDVDFLVEFDDPSSPSYFDDYFSLKEGLERILGRPVDLVTRASIENPYFLQRVETSREPLSLRPERPSISRAPLGLADVEYWPYIGRTRIEGVT